MEGVSTTLISSSYGEVAGDGDRSVVLEESARPRGAQDESGPSQGQVLGRTYSVSGGLGTQNQISSGTQNKNVKLAATPSGWLAVWESGSDIKLRAIGSNGTPSGAERASTPSMKADSMPPCTRPMPLAWRFKA